MKLAANDMALSWFLAALSRFNAVQHKMLYFELWNNFIEDFYKNANQSLPY